MANKIQTTLVKDSATIPKHIPDRKSRLKSSSRVMRQGSPRLKSWEELSRMW